MICFFPSLSPLLENLDLRGNYLNGRIPDFKNVPNIKAIRLNWNQLTGNVPPSVTKLSQLQDLDLTENNMFGFVPDQMCSKGLQTLAVDCNTVSCSCCTQCASEETRAPVVLPPSPPTPPPTRNPTPPPTPAPTPPPTFGRCFDSIATSKSCYLVGEPISITFTNCNPQGNDWVGAYASNVQSGGHFNPLLWKWSCGTQGCFGAVTQGNLSLDNDALGSSGWPLVRGTYKAWLFRRGSGAPFPTIAETATFIVRDNACF